MSKMSQPQHLAEVVENGLCIGCGLCRSIAGDERITFGMTPEGRERPVERVPLDSPTWARIAAVCPGVRIEGQDQRLLDPQATLDPIWGPYLRMDRGYASDPTVRFQASTGGVLTALALYLLGQRKVDFILHVKASRTQPMRSEWSLSFDRVAVLERSQSRYGPAAPLADFEAVLARQQAFAFVGKPCDVGALRLLARTDSRVNRYCRYMLALVCGGASELSKSQDLLEEYGLSEAELSVFRYRGFGNPGVTRIETKDGRVFEKTYLDLWKDESRWRLQNRCKICPDAIGEVADIAASDVWPGGAPTGEDAGFNGIIARTRKGVELLQAAIRDGVLTVDKILSPRDMDDFQPHQVRKKKAVWARLAGMRATGKPVPEVIGLRIEELATNNTLAANLEEARGARQRAKQGRMTEPPVSHQKSKDTAD